MDNLMQRLFELCEEHDIDMPDNLMDIDAYKFGGDFGEVQRLLQDLYELYYAACDCYDDE
jgi:hypothetical protein